VYAGLGPGALLVLFAGLLAWYEPSRAALAPATPYLCFGALAAAAFLSWYYDQSRPLFAAAVVAVSVVAFDHPPAEWTARPLIAALLVPVNFALFALLRERGVLSFDGLVLAGLVVAQIVAMPWLAATGEQSASVLPIWVESLETGPDLPRLAAIAFAAAGVVLLVLVARRRRKVETGLFWALVAMAAGFSAATDTGLWFAAGTAGLALALGVLEHGRDMAERDDLTGLPGRRAFRTVIERARRPYAVAICDVDHFKRFNDTFGHDAGDQVLKMVAAKLLGVGGGGRVFRLGGEEFAILFRGRSAGEAAPFVEEARQAVASAGFTPRHPLRRASKPAADLPLPSHPVAPRLTITISVGLADAWSHATPDLVVDAADLAMYEAKQAGRNCVRLAGGAP
jgi:diguanylate cyclase (GGDEF)-like protein